jgi:magnesium chelatase family protein
LPGILPRMTLEESVEITKIYSVAGLMKGKSSLAVERPFRAPHHTISHAGLIGGGSVPRPGEVSLSHLGVLFLDELPEFGKSVLEVLRQPLEDGEVTISRAAMSLTWPARGMLAAAMNPCPCGHRGNPRQDCVCEPRQIEFYLSRLSGPLLDRIDLHIDVPGLSWDELSGRPKGENSAVVRKRVDAARLLQRARFKGTVNIFNNAQMGQSHLRKHCGLDEAGMGLMKLAVDRMGLSARAYDRVLKVARTIADLEGAPSIISSHLAEAIQYRGLDRPLREAA